MPVLGKHTIPATPAVQKAQGKVLGEMREQAINSVMKFFQKKEVMQSLVGKLKDAQQPLEVEIGRTTALVAERVLQQAKEDGLEMPQSAIWLLPNAESSNIGVVGTLAVFQAELAERLGLTEDKSKLIQMSIMYAAKEGLRAPGIAEGAGALAEIFEKSKDSGPTKETMGATLGLLNRVSSTSGSNEYGV